MNDLEKEQVMFGSGMLQVMIMKEVIMSIHLGVSARGRF